MPKAAKKAAPPPEAVAEAPAKKAKRPPRPKVVKPEPAAAAPLLVEQLPIAEVLPAKRNARGHDERNLDAIRASFQEFGQVEPLLMRKEDNRLIGGNGRLKVAQELGWTHISVIRLSMSELRSESLGIQLNRTAELAHWDLDVLGQISMDLRDAGIELTQYGWSEEELDSVFKPAESDLDAQFSADDADDDAPAAGDTIAPTGADAGQQPADHVRMVQLFFTEDSQKEFMELADQAMQALGHDNLTDTVLAVMRLYAAEKA